MFSGIDAHLTTVLLATLVLCVARNACFLSVELNKSSCDAQSSLQNISVVGYVLAVASFCCFILMFAGLAMDELFNYSVSFLPKADDFKNWKIFAFAAIYGCTISAVLRYLEFKSIQLVKNEVFQCITTLSPIMTLSLELLAVKVGVLQSSVTFSAEMLWASFLIVLGSILVVLFRHRV